MCVKKKGGGGGGGGGGGRRRVSGATSETFRFGSRFSYSLSRVTISHTGFVS